MSMKNNWIAEQTQLQLSSVGQVVSLLESGATIPFIARYRKDQTGNLDEVAVAAIADHLKAYQTLEARRETVLNTLAEAGINLPELLNRIRNCNDLKELEDLYLPYKPRRKTRASIAKSLGLEKLAAQLMRQEATDPQSLAARYIKPDVPNIEAALSGARDIISEWVSEHAGLRRQIRLLYQREALIASKISKGKESEADVYQQYFEFSEPLKRCPSHRFLALMRGAEAGLLKVKISVDQEKALEQVQRYFVKGRHASSEQVALACKDAWTRLLAPAMETEARNAARERSEIEAIRVFSENLKQLLMAPPLGPTRVLALDPGFQSGCKCVCLDASGDLLYNENIYPFKSRDEALRAAKKVSNLVSTYKLDAIAIGNGTAGRETADWIEQIRFERPVKAFLVNEDGASVYSASALGREEFPGYDITVRGAVSIGRRLMDPLAELVKIDPKSLGVGQYQHDVDATKLRESLERTISFCVNAVGVNLNTASAHLLQYVSGLGPTLAAKIVERRSALGPYANRKDLLDIKGLGEKAYQQCAGFLRIPESSDPLDNSAVHPEHYTVVAQIAADLKAAIADLIGNKPLLQQVENHRYESAEIGRLTMGDILKELEKPGRDPREAVSHFRFAPHIRSITDLKVGMTLPAMIVNVTRFGAFADIGIKESGLIHISMLANRFVSDPMEVLHLQQQVRVKVIEVDISRKRIALSLKDADT
jgi:protein Tex